MAEFAALTVAQAIQRLDRTLQQLNASLQQLEERTAVQIEFLRRELGRLEDKVEARATQASLDELRTEVQARATQASVDELRSDVKSIKGSVALILDRTVTKSS